MKKSNNWKNVTKSNPCTICGKADWCSFDEASGNKICRRVNSTDAITKIDRSGSEYYFYKNVSSNKTFYFREVEQEISRIKTMPGDEILHQVYDHLLNFLDLSMSDRAELKDRGLNSQDIDLAKYRSFAPNDQHKLISKLLGVFDKDLLMNIPGLRKSKIKDKLLFCCTPGLVVPVRNENHKIVALKIRQRGNRLPKYVYASSKKFGGNGPKARVHFPYREYHHEKVIRITEGELKADISTIKSGIYTLGLPGVSTWRQVSSLIKKLPIETILIAFDADYEKNPNVAAALVGVVQHFKNQKINVEVELW